MAAAGKQNRQPDKLTTKHSKDLNLGIKSFGLEFTIDKLHEFATIHKKPIVSVGSGNGILEFSYEKKYGQQIVCVDPHVKSGKSWNPSTGKQDAITYKVPDFATVDDLIKRPELVGNSVLILNWCIPSSQMLTGKVGYDLEAVVKLRPVGFFTVVENIDAERTMEGGAGSAEFHAYLKSQLKSQQPFYVPVQIITLKDTKKHKSIQLWQRSNLAKTQLPPQISIETLNKEDLEIDIESEITLQLVKIEEQLDKMESDAERLVFIDKLIKGAKNGTTNPSLLPMIFMIRQTLVSDAANQAKTVPVKQPSASAAANQAKTVSVKQPSESAAASKPASPVGFCQKCKKVASSRCAKCKSVFYCGQEHQKEDWPNHKSVCAELTNAAAASKPAAAKPGGYSPHTWFHHCY